jgi:hypothetical protein
MKPNASRPRKLATLKNAVNALCKNQATGDEVDALIAELLERGHVTIEGEVVHFHLRDKLS